MSEREREKHTETKHTTIHSVSNAQTTTQACATRRCCFNEFAFYELKKVSSL